VEVVDAQLHVWDWDSPHRPWVNPARNSQQAVGRITHDEMVVQMDAVGVSAGIIATPAIYGSDNGYLLEAAERHRGRFRVVGRVDADAPDVADQVARLAASPFAVGVRLITRTQAAAERLHAGGFEQLLRAAERHGLVVCVLSPGHAADILWLARKHPNLRVAVDHLGLAVPSAGGREADPFGDLPAVLGLVSCQNLVIKLTGAPALSSRTFPFTDLWPHLYKMIDVFGPGRLMWGSDWTRVGNATFGEGVRYLDAIAGITPAERALIMGQTLRRVFSWPAS
jgi:L-fuconolactonase